MAVVDLRTQPAVDWRETIVDRYGFLPYSWVRRLTPESQRALMVRELDDMLASENACLLGYVSGGELQGFAAMHRLEWDTAHFAAQIWRLDHLGAWGSPDVRWKAAGRLARAVVRRARERRIQGLQTRLPLGNLAAIQAVEGVGFRTVEVLTTWQFDLTQSAIPPKKYPDRVRDARPSDADALIALARAAYAPTPDRFHADPRLSSKASSELYAEWMRNSILGAKADHIAVAESDGQAVGYSTLHDLGDCDGLSNLHLAQLGLGAMAPHLRDQGLVTDVVIHNLEWLRDHQGDLCFVGTQGNNIPPQRVWLRIGFKPAAMSLSLHLWLDRP